MRLFSKVKPGTAFAAEVQNSGHQIPKPAALNTDTEDNAREHQVFNQAARVAIEADIILKQAAKMQQVSQRHIATLWTDGSLGNIDGLPDRKSRIYIPDSMPVVHVEMRLLGKVVSQQVDTDFLPLDQVPTWVLDTARDARVDGSRLVDSEGPLDLARGSLCSKRKAHLRECRSKSCQQLILTAV
ncbi:hypothetical protein WJX77_011620 [Trebouxia sp. C0004]